MLLMYEHHISIAELGVSENPNKSVVVKNIAPLSWSGRKFDVELYKFDRLFAIQPDVHVDSQVDFVLEPKLYFGVGRNMRVGQTFSSMQITSATTMFDLTQYPNGLIVTLKQMPGGGKYVFSAENM